MILKGKAKIRFCNKKTIGNEKHKSLKKSKLNKELG